MEGFAEEFFRRLGALGGPPPGWRIYPHAGSDGKALHIIEAESREEIIEHLNNFAGIYDRGEIIEIIDRGR